MTHTRRRALLSAATLFGVGLTSLALSIPASADVPTNPDGSTTYLGTSATASDPYAFRCAQPGNASVIGYCLVTSSDLTSGPLRTDGGGKNFYPMNTTKIIYSPDGVAWSSARTALTEDRLGLANGADGQPTNHLWAPAVRFKSTGSGGSAVASYHLYAPDLTNPDDALSSRIFVTYSPDVNTQFGYQNLPGTSSKVAQVTGAPAGVYMSDPEVFTNSNVIGDSNTSNDYLLWANGDYSTCGDISIRKMTSPTAIQSYTSSAASQDSVRIKINGFPSDWGKCSASAGRFSGTQVNWPYVEGASMFKTSNWSYQPGYGALPELHSPRFFKSSGRGIEMTL